MPILAESIDALLAVDTHLDTHTAVLLNPVGAVLTDICVAGPRRSWIRPLRARPTRSSWSWTATNG
jgi:hypothetical protein